MAVHLSSESQHLATESPPGAACRWETIRYAIGSTACTIRLCAVMLAASLPPSLFLFILHR